MQRYPQYGLDLGSLCLHLIIQAALQLQLLQWTSNWRR
jgi:hypothetical protein